MGRKRTVGLFLLGILSASAAVHAQDREPPVRDSESTEPAESTESTELTPASSESSLVVPSSTAVIEPTEVRSTVVTREGAPGFVGASEPGRYGSVGPLAASPSSSDGDGSSIQISGKQGYGLTIEVNDSFSLNIRSRFLLRYQLRVPPQGADGERRLDQTVNVATARLWLSGKAFSPEISYLIQLAVAERDFRDGVSSPLFDAYLDYQPHRDINVRAGQFFVPFDRLRTVREWALQMGERPIPVQELTLDRDVGVMAYSDRFLGDESWLAWRFGVFGGGGINLASGKEPGALVVGRLELRPLGPIDDDQEGDLLRRARPGLALGVGVAGNLNTNRLRSTTGLRFQGGVTSYLHSAVDLVFKWRGIGLQAAYLRKDASVDRIDSTDSTGAALTEYTRAAQGWVLQASYAFEAPIEIVGRLSGLYAMEGTDPVLVAETRNFGQELAAGLNYYLNGHRFKLQADWITRTSHDFSFDQVDQVGHVQVDVTF